MTESQWALLVGFVIVGGTRVIDVFLPKGYMARWAAKYLIKKDDDSYTDDSVERRVRDVGRDPDRRDTPEDEND
jgi:hypothetical protein